MPPIVNDQWRRHPSNCPCDFSNVELILIVLDRYKLFKRAHRMFMWRSHGVIPKKKKKKNLPKILEIVSKKTKHCNKNLIASICLCVSTTNIELNILIWFQIQIQPRKKDFIKSIIPIIIFETYEITAFCLVLDNGDRARGVLNHKAAHASHYYPVSVFKLISHLHTWKKIHYTCRGKNDNLGKFMNDMKIFISID